MKVYSYQVKVYLLKDIAYPMLMEKQCQLIDSCLISDPNWIIWHETNQAVKYSFGGLQPLETNKIYKEGNIYSFSLRTLNADLGTFFKDILKDCFTPFLKVLTIESKILPSIQLSRIYTTTPAIVKTENGYWRSSLSLDDFEDRLKTNLVKKYNALTKRKMNEEFQLFTHLKFDNFKPVAMSYKEIKLLGDKMTLILAPNPSAQELASIALGTGLGEMGSRGFGFCGYKFA